MSVNFLVQAVAIPTALRLIAMDACAAGTDAPTLVLGLKAWVGGWEGLGGGGVEGVIDSCPMQRSPCDLSHSIQWSTAFLSMPLTLDSRCKCIEKRETRFYSSYKL